MPNTTPAVKRVEDHDTRGPGSPPETSAAVGRWTAGLLSSAGTLALAYLLSPGLRLDLAGLAALLGNISAAGIESWLLSFGALSPIVYFLTMVGQVVLSPIPAGPVALAGSLVFGVWEGLTLSLAGSVVGSVLVFLAARRWGRRSSGGLSARRS